MKGKLTIIDGISNAGKTSFCEYMSKLGYVLIEEVPLFIAKHKDKYDNIAPAVPKTLEEEMINQEILLKAEYGRLIEAEKLVLEGKMVIMDRSFLSTVAMAYALEKDTPFIGSYENAKRLGEEYLLKILELSSNMDIQFIIFDVNYHTLIDRNHCREKPLNDEWIDEEFLSKQKMLFKAFASILNGQLIDTSNLSFEQIQEQIYSDDNAKKI